MTSEDASASEPRGPHGPSVADDPSDEDAAGRLLLHDETEWRRRQSRYPWRGWALIIGIMTPICLLLMLPIVMQISSPHLVDWELLAYASTCVLAFIALWGAYTRWRTSPRALSRVDRRVPGIYERGVAVPLFAPDFSVFLPYGDISDVRERELLRMRFYTISRRGAGRSINVPSWYMGEDGLALMQELLLRPPPKGEPPELVLYGRRGLAGHRAKR